MMRCPFWNHESYVTYIVRNMSRGQDNVFLYEGEEGSGKSNGAIWDAKRIHERLGKVFDVRNDPIFNRKQWDERFEHGEKQRVYELDEFENIAFSRDFNKADNKGFVKLIQQARILRSTLICVMPYFQFADVYFRQGRFRVRVHFERVTDFDVYCKVCTMKHEVREATYYWRQRTEDMTTGQVTMGWREVFTARHCPLAAVEPEAWNGYEERKERSVRETILKRRADVAEETELLEEAVLPRHRKG